MNEPRPLYELRELRYDRSERVVYETREPGDAQAALEALRAAGDRDIRLVILEARDEDVIG